MLEKNLTTKNTTTPLILGILSIPGAYFPILGIILGIVGILLSKNTFKEDIKARIGFILSIIGLIISSIIFVIAFYHGFVRGWDATTIKVKH